MTAMDSPEIADAVASGEADPVEIVESFLSVVDERESEVRAWAHVDPDLARTQAGALDRVRRPLLGVPVGIKDVIDTEDMPTTYNSPLYEDHQPSRDAACVSLLRSAGAVIMGKTGTVEFASLGRNPDTTNPHDATRTPGGSSCGSGAAVGAGMVPVALGTQTGGSTIRPASFCGVYGMKPTYGLVSFEGTKPYAPSLDTIGWMGRSVGDLAAVAEALGAVPAPPAAVDPSTLRIGVYRTPAWDMADAASRDAVHEAAEQFRALGATVEDIDGPAEFARLTDAQDIIMHWEGQAAFRAEYERFGSALHQGFRDEVENSKGRTAVQAAEAYDFLGTCRGLFDATFGAYDALLTPAVLGEATVGLESTGMATYNRMFTALHGPNITVPTARGEHGLPIGVQLVSGRFHDKALLGIAALLTPAGG